MTINITKCIENSIKSEESLRRICSEIIIFVLNHFFNNIEKISEIVSGKIERCLDIKIPNDLKNIFIFKNEINTSDILEVFKKYNIIENVKEIKVFNYIIKLQNNTGDVFIIDLLFFFENDEEKINEMKYFIKWYFNENFYGVISNLNTLSINERLFKILKHNIDYKSILHGSTLLPLIISKNIEFYLIFKSKKYDFYLLRLLKSKKDILFIVNNKNLNIILTK